MKLSKLALIAAMVGGMHAGAASGQQGNARFHQTSSPSDAVVSSDRGARYAGCDACGEPVCGCEPVVYGHGACDAGCTNGCDACDSGSILGDCCLGDPFTLFGERCGWSAGGWVQLGYHSHRANNNHRLNEYDGRVQLQQAWLWAQKEADGRCGLDFGGRIDYLYGTDGQDLQAFGRESGFDNSWDHGGHYGHALPQLYGEAAYGDLSVMAGRFYTPIGWESIAAPNNFFYSHAYTMYNSEPFTHTGLLASYDVNRAVSVFGGYVLGWNSGFEDNGDAFLGGFRARLSDDLGFTYAAVGGRFNEGPFRSRPRSPLVAGSERGYMHSIIVDARLTDRLQYVFQTDYLDTEDAGGQTVRDTIGINQYLLYTINDCWAVGGRFEWWQAEGTAFDPAQPNEEYDVYDLTLGVNYRPHANLVVRPEVRWDWDRDRLGINEENDAAQTTFGIDAILTF